MFFMNLFNIITLVFSPLSKVTKKLNKFCEKVIEKMKKIYDKRKEQKINEVNLINIENSRNINNNNIINNINLNENNNIKKDKKDKKDKKRLKDNNNINNNNTILNNSKKKKKSSNTKIVFGNNNENPSDSNSKLDNNLKNDNSNLGLNKKKTHNLKTQTNEASKNEDKILNELKKKSNSDYYIYNVIKFIPYEKRRKYLSESEIESLSYKNAVQIENRNKSTYYFALLKEKNIIISIFLNDKDYNISSVKISLFIFSFNLSLTINALFFNDEAIYEINQDNGSFNLETQIMRILYSAIISAFIGFIVKLIALTHSNIIELRNYKKIKTAKEKVPKLISKLQLRYVIFYVITILLNLSFFYYIMAFCAVYSIIQTHMISDSLMSFLLTMSYSLILSLISSIIRIFSLKKENKFRHFLYLISWVISLI